MKKILGVIIGLFMFIPLVVLADMSGPLVREYEFEVTNPNGAKLYKYDYNNEKETYTETDTIVPYGYKFEVMDEELGEYVDVSSEDNKYDGYIKTSDGRTIVPDFKITEKELGEKQDIIALVDIEIKKGPSPGYAGTGVKIKAGTKLTGRSILRYDEEEKKYVPEEFDPWLYVEYNKTKGYVIAYEGTIGFDIGKQNAITDSDTELYKLYSDYYADESEQVKSIATIPANTKLTTQTYALDIWGGAYYIEYNGKKGFVSSGSYYLEDESIEFTTTKKLNVYEKVTIDDNENITSKVIGTIPKGTKFKSKYYDPENWAITIRYENGNTKGWVYAKTDEDDESSDEYLGLSFKYPYEDENETESKPSTEPELEPVDEPEEPSDITSPNVVPEKEPVTIPKRNFSMDILYYCIGAAAIIAITAAVTVTLVNRKKKDKVEEQPK